MKIEDIEEDFIGVYSRVGGSIGFPDLPAKIIGILYLGSSEVSIDELAAKTGYSLASISTTTRIMETMGVISRVKKPGTKKVFYYMDKDLARMNIVKLDLMQQNFIGPMKEGLPPIINKYRNKTRDKDTKKKFELVESYYRQTLQLEDLLTEWRKQLEALSRKNKR
jgi:HTH-type transcriptional regulator, osmoprotectant uptake regulator